MRPTPALLLAAALPFFAACGGHASTDSSPVVNEAGGDAGTDGGTPNAGPDGGVAVEAPNGTFAQYFGQPDAVGTGCGVSGISDQHFGTCAIYALSGNTEVDVGLWSLAPDARSTDAVHLWSWDVEPVDPSMPSVGPVWAGIAQAPSGDTFVAGTFGGNAMLDATVHPAGVVGSFLARFAADGLSAQTQPLGGSQGEVTLTAISTTAVGKVLVAGRYSGSQSFGTVSAASPDPHPFLMQLSGLTPVWLTDLAAAGEEGQVEALAPFFDGGALVGGSRASVGQPAQPFLARVDANGTVLWEKTFPGLQGAVTHLSTDGESWYASLAATGSFTWGARDATLASGQGALIAGSDQNSLWVQTSQVPLTALAAGQSRLVAIGAAGQDAVFGDGTVAMPSGSPSVFLLGLDPTSGAERWSRVYTSTAAPFAFTDAALLPSTRLLISGQQRVPTDFGVGWEPSDQGAPVGLWLVLSPLP